MNDIKKKTPNYMRFISDGTKKTQNYINVIHNHKHINVYKIYQDDMVNKRTLDYKTYI